MFVTFLYILLFSPLHAKECVATNSTDELEVYLLTTGPGNAMYSKVGHSALWISGGGYEERVLNWGAYDSDQEYFLWKFFMGTAEYKLSIMSRQRNDLRIHNENQNLRAQHLNLPPEMKAQLKEKLDWLMLPENRNYLYHWEKQNCATLIRDVLDDVTNHAIQNTHAHKTLPTKRQEVLRHVESNFAFWFGWHYMGSAYADMTYDQWNFLHIPQRLMETIDQTTITWEDGWERPLVDYSCILHQSSMLQESNGWAKPVSPDHTLLLWAIGTALGGLCWWMQQSTTYLRWIVYGILSVFWMGFGLLSAFFMFCWLCSSLDGYGFNANWYYSSPLFLLLPWLVYTHLQKRETPSLVWVARIIGVLTVLGITNVLVDTHHQENLDIMGLFVGINGVLFGVYGYQKTSSK